MSRTPGVRFENGIASAVLWAPEAEKVTLLVNDVEIPMQQIDLGYWEATTDLIKPGDNYRIVINDGDPLPDVASLSQPEGVHGPSQAMDLTAFDWHDQEWINPAQKDYIIYELHTGTFSTEGSFEGTIPHLDHLIDLGITAIEIMPVAQFPGERNWGYDGVFPYAVQNSYGGAIGLMKLVDACHQKGLAVILDVVYNHVGPEGNYFQQSGPYFTEKYHTPWGSAVNFDDEWCDGVREYFIGNALMWLRDFHIDALRMDAVHAIKDFSPKHILKEIKENVNELMAASSKKFYLINELDLNDTRFIENPAKGGFGIDAQWVDEFHHALRVTAGGSRDGYYSDFNGINDLAKSYSDAYVFDGRYSPHRKKIFGSKATGFRGERFVVFSQNHDQVGNRMLGERSSVLFSFEMQKLMAGAVMVSPYIPLLFMGEEWGAHSPFQYFVSHGDPELVEAVRKGRKAEFAAFHAKGEAPDPQDEATYSRSKLDWTKIDPLMLHFYKQLIALRKQTPALSELQRESLKIDVDEASNLLFLKRWANGSSAYCILNFSKSAHHFNLPFGDWQLALNSADEEFGGTRLPNRQIQSESIIIFIGSHV